MKTKDPLALIVLFGAIYVFLLIGVLHLLLAITFKHLGYFIISLCSFELTHFIGRTFKLI